MQLTQAACVPWLYVGDFNKLLKSLEKLRDLLQPYG